MDGGLTSIPSDHLPPASDPLSLTDQIQLLLSYAEDRGAKISLLKTILKRKQECLIPLDVPRDLILEAKIRLSDDRKASAARAATIPSLERSPSVEALLQVEQHLGRMLSDDELVAVVDSPTPRGAAGGELDHTMVQNPLTNATGSSSSDPKNMHAEQMTESWSSLFHKQPNRSRDLQRHAQPSTDPDHHVVFDDEDSFAAIQSWGNSLVGYFIGKAPPISEIKLCLSKAWRMQDLEIIPMADGFLLFKFHSHDAGQQILDDGPWFVYGRPLILRRWAVDINMGRDNLESIPVWVRLPNLNFCFRTTSALSKIASVIGNPICMDHATAAGTRYAFARVCVEVDVDAEFPTELRMKYKEKTITQKIEYAWRPHPCKTCRTFNHGDSSCPLKVSQHKPKKVWVPKHSSYGETPLVDVATRASDAAHDGAVEKVAEDAAGALIQRDVMQHDSELLEWNVVKGKRSPSRASSPDKVHASPVKSSTQDLTVASNRFLSLSTIEGDSSVGPEESPSLVSSSSRPPVNKAITSQGVVHTPVPVSHRFLSLSNLDGDSSVSADEIEQTTALVLQGATGGIQPIAVSQQMEFPRAHVHTGADLHGKASSHVQRTTSENLSSQSDCQVAVKQSGPSLKSKQRSSGAVNKERSTLKSGFFNGL